MDSILSNKMNNSGGSTSSTSSGSSGYHHHHHQHQHQDNISGGRLNIISSSSSSPGNYLPQPAGPLLPNNNNHINPPSSNFLDHLPCNYTTTAIASPPPSSSSSSSSKKRPRASRRAPTTVLTTDTSNFRAMVQEFTGFPTPPFPSSSSSNVIPGLGLMRSSPLAFHPSSSSLLSATRLSAPQNNNNNIMMPPPSAYPSFLLNHPACTPPQLGDLGSLVASSDGLHQHQQQQQLQSGGRLPNISWQDFGVVSSAGGSSAGRGNINDDQEDAELRSENKRQKTTIHSSDPSS